MLNKLNLFLSKNYLPRGIILFFDFSVVIFSVIFAHLVLDKVHLNINEQDLIFRQILATVPVYLVSFLIFRPFSEVIRHSTIEDVLKIFYSLTTAMLILLLVNVFLPENSILYASKSIILLQFLIVLALMVTSRVFIKTFYHTFLQVKHTNKNILIYGAGSLGQLTYNAIINDGESKSKVVAFIDDNKSLQNKRVNTLPVYSAERAFEKVVKENNISELIIAISSANLEKANKRKVIDLSIKNRLQIKEVPEVDRWINGGINVKQFRNVNIEDLLGRDTIQLDRRKIREGVKDATILVTGAAGSIGSEIVRQLIAFQAKQVLLVDWAESAMYDLQTELRSTHTGSTFKEIICDISNEKKLRKLIEKYRPNMVFHAAAYKHVPLMEEQPCEALRVNIGGTKVLADLAVEYGIETFVYISTDKAVNPSSVMGASKRISEIYIQSLAQQQDTYTKFITTRFGNVLGSNGSVIPLFKKQIEKGGPVTVTNKNITRFFMTIPEACQLVLEAGFMGKGGEIFVFDMGEPVRIYDLAEKMISLSGFIPHKDIKIQISGLRPGEKLYEELMLKQEGLLPTHNSKIMIGKFQRFDYRAVNHAVSYLINTVDDLSKHDLVAQMKKIVPEYISMNSVHCCLDKETEKVLVERN